MNDNKTGETLFAEERRRKIVALVNETRKVTVPEICERYNISPATARADLRDLQNDGLLVRTHGGAIATARQGVELNSIQREVRMQAEKQRIGMAALDLVDDGDRILMDTGTTTIELARLLRRKRNLTVATNDLAIAILLEESESMTVIVLGGILRHKFHCTLGDQHRDTLAGLTFDKAFMAANGFSIEAGATTPRIEQAMSKQAMIESAKTVILLCDSSKFKEVVFARFAKPEQIDTLVTDEIDPSSKRVIEDNGIEVILAPHG